MEQAIRLPDKFHVKMVTSIYMLTVIDYIGTVLAIRSVVLYGPSMCILIANEYCLMLVSLLSIATRYALNLNDIRRGGPWDERSSYLFYLDFAFGIHHVENTCSLGLIHI